MGKFREIRSSVHDCLKKRNISNNGKEDLHARHFFKEKKGNIEEESLTLADLKWEYQRISFIAVFILLVTVFAMWLIGYQILKFVNFFRCPSHLWSWKYSCLPGDELMKYLDKNCLE